MRITPGATADRIIWGKNKPMLTEPKTKIHDTDLAERLD
jgi:hypothetical protein